jgi:hypothetical protein
MKRQAVAAKSELAKVNSPFCAASEPRRLELLRPAAVVPALPRIGLPKEFPDRQSRTMTLPKDCRYVSAPLLGVGRGFLAPRRYRASLDLVDRPSLIGRMATNSIAEMACYPPVVCLRVASSAWGPVYLET